MLFHQQEEQGIVRRRERKNGHHLITRITAAPEEASGRRNLPVAVSCQLCGAACRSGGSFTHANQEFAGVEEEDALSWRREAAVVGSVPLFLSDSDEMSPPYPRLKIKTTVIHPTGRGMTFDVPHPKTSPVNSIYSRNLKKR